MASETLISQGTESGLNKDPYDNTRYVYKGSNPKNYIKYNNEVYRIVSVESDGTIKIIRDEKVINLPYDQANGTDAGKRYNKNNTYCTTWHNLYIGCNAWSAVQGTYVSGSHKGTVTEDSDMKIYLNDTYYNTLNSTAKNQIQTHNFNVGSVSSISLAKTAETEEKENTWNGNVALINLTDWLKASDNSNCTGDINEYNNSDTYVAKCNIDNYLFKNYSWWTLTPLKDDTNGVFEVEAKGYYYGPGACRSGYWVRPSIYLKANLKLSGTGLQADPYIIE